MPTCQLTEDARRVVGYFKFPRTVTALVHPETKAPFATLTWAEQCKVVDQVFNTTEDKQQQWAKLLNLSTYANMSPSEALAHIAEVCSNLGYKVDDQFQKMAIFETMRRDPTLEAIGRMGVADMMEDTKVTPTAVANKLQQAWRNHMSDKRKQKRTSSMVSNTDVDTEADANVAAVTTAPVIQKKQRTDPVTPITWTKPVLANHAREQISKPNDINDELFQKNRAQITRVLYSQAYNRLSPKEHQEVVDIAIADNWQAIMKEAQGRNACMYCHAGGCYDASSRAAHTRNCNKSILAAMLRMYSGRMQAERAARQQRNNYSQQYSKPQYNQTQYNQRQYTGNQGRYNAPMYDYGDPQYMPAGPMGPPGMTPQMYNQPPGGQMSQGPRSYGRGAGRGGRGNSMRGPPRGPQPRTNSMYMEDNNESADYYSDDICEPASVQTPSIFSSQATQTPMVIDLPIKCTSYDELQSIKHADLYAGIGGFTQGAMRLNSKSQRLQGLDTPYDVHTLYATDTNATAIGAYAKLHQHVDMTEVTTVDTPQMHDALLWHNPDLVTISPPVVRDVFEGKQQTYVPETEVAHAVFASLNARVPLIVINTCAAILRTELFRKAQSQAVQHGYI